MNIVLFILLYFTLYFLIIRILKIDTLLLKNILRKLEKNLLKLKANLKMVSIRNIGRKNEG